MAIPIPSIIWGAGPSVWSPGVPVRDDIEQEFEATVTAVETIGGQSKLTRWTPATLDGRRTFRRVRFSYLPREKVFADASTDVALEDFWRSDGIGRFKYAPDGSAPGAFVEYFLRESSAAAFKPKRMFDGVELYEIELEMGKFTT